MPSLKDLRNRIAATKATQKITKAMQMVAASKLRRAQAAAEAARPYATQMDKVLGNIAASVAGCETAPRLLRGTGGSDRHLLLVCTAERGLCGPFNTADRAAGARARQRADGARARRSSSSASAARATISCAVSTQRRSSRWSTCARRGRCVSSTPR